MALKGLHLCALALVVVFVAVQCSPMMSVPFKSPLYHFDCPSVACTSEVLVDSIFHVVVGTDHKSSFPLLVHQVCSVRQWCMKNQNILIVLHSGSPLEKRDLLDKDSGMYKCQSFLEEQNIKFRLWYDPEFTANSKMFESFKTLKSVSSPQQLIYQIDLDELPHPFQFGAALSEIQEGSCDAIKAQWRDRVDRKGKLKMPVISLPDKHGDYKSVSLQHQFPLR